MLAMKATLMEDESDDEQILYPQIDRQSTPLTGTSTWPVSVFPPPLSAAPRSPKPAKTTAEDLLSRVLNQNVAPSPPLHATLDTRVGFGSAGRPLAPSLHSLPQSSATLRGKVVSGASSSASIPELSWANHGSPLRYSGSFQPQAQIYTNASDTRNPTLSPQLHAPPMIEPNTLPHGRHPGFSHRGTHSFGPIGSPRLLSSGSQIPFSPSEYMPTSTPSLHTSKFTHGSGIHPGLKPSLPSPVATPPWT